MPQCATCGVDLHPDATAPTCDNCTAAELEQQKTGAPRKPQRNDFAGHITAFPVSSALIAVNIAVFVAIVASGLRLWPQYGGTFWHAFWQVVEHPSGALLAKLANFGPRTVSGQWWRLITNVFVHIGIVHLIVNMWALFNLGALAEYIFGRRTTFVTYLLTGIAGSLTSLAWHPLAGSAGASGAILGLAGALIVAIRFARLPLGKRELRITATALGVFAAYTLIAGLLTSVWADRLAAIYHAHVIGPWLALLFPPNVDNAAHLGGLCAGIIFGVAIVMSHRRADSKELQLAFPEELMLLAAVVIAGFIIGRNQRYVGPLERGEIALQQNNLQQAVTELRRAVTMRPNKAEPHVRLGEAYYRGRHVGPAQSEFVQATRVEPRSSEAWGTLGSFYLAAGEGQEAAYALSRAVELRPKSASLQFDYGVALQATNKFDDALAAFRRAGQLDPANAGNTRFMIGLVQVRQGKYDDAIATLNDYLRTQRDDWRAYAALAECYRRKGMTADADENERKAQELRPQQ